MDSIQIDTGLKKILINGDENVFIEFNPEDILFAEHFYALVQDFGIKQKEFEARSAALGVDGKPNLPANMALIKEMCVYLREQVDTLFGKGTSQKIFGDAMVLRMFEQFFTGLTPYIQIAREQKVAKYVVTKPAQKVPYKKAVMK
jgi:hypothetical protein